MKKPSPMLLALYERCLIGALVACEVSVRELSVEANDFSDVKARRLFVLIAELAEDGVLEYPTAAKVVSTALESAEFSGALQSYLADAYVDFVSRVNALTYDRIIAAEGQERRDRRTLAAQISGRAA
jgi:hypothetical protein